jgi:hypothetical protein
METKGNHFAANIGGAKAGVDTVVLTGSGNWVVPASALEIDGVVVIRVFMIAGGASGGNYQNEEGGGGSGLFSLEIVNTFIGESFSFSCGLAGVIGFYGSRGADGNQTIFGSYSVSGGIKGSHSYISEPPNASNRYGYGGVSAVDGKGGIIQCVGVGYGNGGCGHNPPYYAAADGAIFVSLERA